MRHGHTTGGKRSGVMSSERRHSTPDSAAATCGWTRPRLGDCPLDEQTDASINGTVEAAFVGPSTRARVFWSSRATRWTSTDRWPSTCARTVASRRPAEAFGAGADAVGDGRAQLAAASRFSSSTQLSTTFRRVGCASGSTSTITNPVPSGKTSKFLFAVVSKGPLKSATGAPAANSVPQPPTGTAISVAPVM